MWKRIVIILGYWMIAVLTISIILTSLGLSFIYALMYGLAFVPAAMIAKIIFPNRPIGNISIDLKSIVFVSLMLLALCFALVFSVSWTIYLMDGTFQVQDLGTPPVLTNPAFLVVMVLVLLAGDYFTELYLDKHFPVKDQLIDFISNRKHFQMKQSDILYIESNDTEVWIHASNGEKYRNKTPIGQWESLLGKGFARISRSFLVNRDYITEIGSGYVALGEMRLSSSKKYIPE